MVNELLDQNYRSPPPPPGKFSKIDILTVLNPRCLQLALPFVPRIEKRWPRKGEIRRVLKASHTLHPRADWYALILLRAWEMLHHNVPFSNRLPPTLSLSLPLSIYLSIYPSIHLSIYLSTCISFLRSIMCVCVCLCACVNRGMFGALHVLREEPTYATALTETDGVAFTLVSNLVQQNLRQELYLVLLLLLSSPI